MKARFSLSGLIKPVLAPLVSAYRQLLLERSPLSDWIIKLNYYRNGPLGLVLLVRDEVDVVRENLLFYLDHGVDFMIITDNASTDGTREILGEFSRQENVIVLDEPGTNYDQARWVSRMVDLARSRFKAKWVIPADADEFWLPADGDYRSDLHHASNVYFVHWNNLLPEPGRDWKSFDKVGDFDAYKSRVKVMTGTVGFRRMNFGNHNVEIIPKVESKSGNIKIYHYPVRSYEQFERKIVNGYRAIRSNLTVTPDTCHHWQEWYDAYEKGVLPSVYAAFAEQARVDRVDQTMARYFSNQLRGS